MLSNAAFLHQLHRWTSTQEDAVDRPADAAVRPPVSPGSLVTAAQEMLTTNLHSYSRAVVASVDAAVPPASPRAPPTHPLPSTTTQSMPSQNGSAQPLAPPPLPRGAAPATASLPCSPYEQVRAGCAGSFASSLSSSFLLSAASDEVTSILSGTPPSVDSHRRRCHRRRISGAEEEEGGRPDQRIDCSAAQPYSSSSPGGVAAGRRSRYPSREDAKIMTTIISPAASTGGLKPSHALRHPRAESGAVRSFSSSSSSSSIRHLSQSGSSTSARSPSSCHCPSSCSCREAAEGATSAGRMGQRQWGRTTRCDIGGGDRCSCSTGEEQSSCHCGAGNDDCGASSPSRSRHGRERTDDPVTAALLYGVGVIPVPPPLLRLCHPITSRAAAARDPLQRLPELAAPPPPLPLQRLGDPTDSADGAAPLPARQTALHREAAVTPTARRAMSTQTPPLETEKDDHAEAAAAAATEEWRRVVLEREAATHRLLLDQADAQSRCWSAQQEELHRVVQLLDARVALQQKREDEYRQPSLPIRLDSCTSPVETGLLFPLPSRFSAAQLAQLSVGTQHGSTLMDVDEALAQMEALRHSATTHLMQQEMMALFNAEESHRECIGEMEATARECCLTNGEGVARMQLVTYETRLLQLHQEQLTIQHHQFHRTAIADLLAMEAATRQAIDCSAVEAAEAIRDASHRAEILLLRRSKAEGVATLEAALSSANGAVASLQEELIGRVAEVARLRSELLRVLRLPTIQLASQPACGTSSCFAGGPLADADAIQPEQDYGVPPAAAPSQRWSCTTSSWINRGAGREGDADDDLPVHRRFARAHQEALRATRAQCRRV